MHPYRRCLDLGNCRRTVSSQKQSRSNAAATSLCPVVSDADVVECLASSLQQPKYPCSTGQDTLDSKPNPPLQLGGQMLDSLGGGIDQFQLAPPPDVAPFLCETSPAVA